MTNDTVFCMPIVHLGISFGETSIKFFARF